MQKTDNELSTTDISPIVQAVISPEKMKEAIQVYQKMVKEILGPADIMKIGDKDYIRKSGWQKLAVPFNITTSVIEERYEPILAQDDGSTGRGFAYHIKVRATAPNGRYMEKLGSCDNVYEKKGSGHHIIRSMAETRATSRAISALMGVSEQPAEDMESIPKKNDMPEPNSYPGKISPWCMCDFDKIKMNEAEKKCDNCSKPMSDGQIEMMKK